MFGPCENALIISGIKRCSYRQVWNAIAQDSPIAVCIVDIDGKWLYPHPRIAEWLGFSIKELSARTFQDITYPDDLDADLANVQRLIDRESSYYQMEKRYLSKSGRVVWVRLTVTSLVQGDRVVGFVSQIENISDRKLYEAQLKELILTDPLTGLGNQRHFEDELKRHWRILHRPERDEIPFGLIMIDVNSFKSINDIYGHDTGNCVLKDVAKRIVSATRTEDIQFRPHGDEFAVIMPCTSDVEPAIARLESDLCSSIECEGNLIRYSCSVGGAIANRSFNSLKELYRLADSRMYEKKQKSKCTHYF